jgi:signal transduction histidine kinase
VDSKDDIDRDRAEAGHLLASRGVFGLVWLDDDLIVHSRFGVLVDFIVMGRPLIDSVPACIGLEEDIKALADCRSATLRLPNVSMACADGTAPRLSFSFHRLSNRFVMVVANAGGDGEIEVELSRQIRGRRIAEAELAAKSQELIRTNADLRIANAKLEQFAAIVAHDLKAPMRALRYMTDDLRAALIDGDPDSARIKLDELQRQNARLSSMLSALLRYSSAGPREVAIERVDTRVLVEAIVASLPRNGITVEFSGAWPTLATFSAPLDLALRNLIDNAIKHHDRDSGRVTVACKEAGDALEFSIADDGPGIDPGLHASIFLPFHSPSGNEGIGLAIVQKMVAAVGGSVSVASCPAERRGSMFTVRWPKIGT